MSWLAGWRSWFLLIAVMVCSEQASYGQNWLAGSELLFVKPSITGQIPIVVQRTNQSSNQLISALETDRDFDPAFRVWLGRVSDTGGTLRGRFWYFDHQESLSYTLQAGEEANTFVGGLFEGASASADDAGDVVAWQQQLKAYTCDLEMGQILQPSFGTFHIGGGVRVAGFETDSLGSVNNSTPARSSIERLGIGPTIFAEYERSLSRPLTLFASTRSAVLITDNSEQTTSSDQVNLYRLQFDSEGAMAQQETRFGLNYLKSFGSHDLVAGTFLEHQYWSGAQSFFESSVGFFGVGIQISILR